MNLPIDAFAREQALNIQTSFIVQAPAGSGKTELLIQRYLKLLATSVSEPEEVIAITFTRKAALEMRQRVLQALDDADRNPEPANPHKATTWQIAKAVLTVDQKNQWQLLNNPNRLMILTIDSLCAKITAQMPILSKFGIQPKITDNAIGLYEEAAHLILNTLEESSNWQDDLIELLLHLDNDHEKAKRLLVEMLANRDQWLEHIFNVNTDVQRAQFERSLQNICEITLEKCHNSLINNINVELMLDIYNHAIVELSKQNSHFKLEKVSTLPQGKIANLPFWVNLTKLLLTQDGKTRKKLTIKEGFIASSSLKTIEAKTYHEQKKQQMLALLAELDEHPELLEILFTISVLPPIAYTDSQWHLINSLIHILKITTAQLHVLFKEKRVVDHIEVALRAVHALGHYENPTDLALALDYQIQHILVDEFQDTSVTQFKLLSLLTAGWLPKDNRTIFIVGDPMQSIYRFRKAEVGLFLFVKNYGIGDIQPKFLELKVNFRSKQPIVAWFNGAFQKIFPALEDLATGAIPFAQSFAFDQSADANVKLLALSAEEELLEANTIVEIIRQHPQKKIAILVLARSHLVNILSSLQQAKINYRAIEIAALADKTICQDLLALSRALLQSFDRVAWLALLRAPFCGLNLHDLYIIANAPYPNIPSALQHAKNLALSDTAQQILSRINPVIEFSLANKNRLPFATYLEATWLALGGPACLQGENDIEDAQSFFELIRSIEQSEQSLSIEIMEDRLKLLSASDKTAACQIDIMTIHKAKGLEFDVVILPSLEKRKRSDNHPLLLWQEIANYQDVSDLLVAPIKNQDNEPIYDFLRQLEQKKARFEQMRLLYVAITRAKEHLYLLASIKIDEQQQQKLKPNYHSFLDLLWSYFEHLPIHASNDTKNAANNSYQANQLRRLPEQWRSPLQEAFEQHRQKISPTENLPTWQDQSHTIIGSTIHKLLEHIANQADWFTESQSVIETKIDHLIHQQRLALPLRKEAKNKCLTCWQNICNDEKARQLFQANQQKFAEYALDTVKEDKLEQIKIDYTFVANNKRYLVDYKTASFDGDDLKLFLQDEKRSHEAQLHKYAKAFQHEQIPIICVLYFPLIPTWLEWTFEG